MRLSLPRTLVSLLVAMLSTAALAQEYPTKPVRVISPFAAGGPLDILVRALNDRLGEGLKQPFILENRPGAAGNIGSGAAAKSAADGYTLLATLDTVLTVNPHVYKKMSFDPAKALVPISVLGTFDQMLVAHPSVKAAKLADFIELAKREKLAYASAGSGSPGHLTMELFAQTSGIELLHVPYKGNAPAVADLLGGQVQAAFIATTGVAPHVKSGKLRAYAVSGAARSPLTPEVPTIAELGYPAASVEFAYFLLAPAGTPEEIIATLERETRKAMAEPKVRETLATAGIQVLGSTRTEAAARLQTGAQRWGRVAKALNLRLD